MHNNTTIYRITCPLGMFITTERPEHVTANVIKFTHAHEGKHVTVFCADSWIIEEAAGTEALPPRPAYEPPSPDDIAQAEERFLDQMRTVARAVHEEMQARSAAAD